MSVVVRVQQPGVQGAQFGAGVGAQAVGDQPADVLVGGECLGRAAEVAQGAQAQRLERLVQRVGVAQGGQLGQGRLRLAEGEGGGEPGAPGVETAGLPAGGLRGAVGQIGEGRSVPQGEGIVQEGGGLGRVALGQGGEAVAGEPVEAGEVDVVRGGGEPVAALGGGDGVRAERPAQPAHQGLERPGGVGGRVRAPHLVHQHTRRHGPPGAQRQHAEQRTQPRPADRNGRAVGAERLGGAEQAVTHGVHCLRGSGSGQGAVTGRGRPPRRGRG
ncbi:hypothetical protein SAMN04490357_2696 [Streptomyces misionensis]|uniref:Uncharacterized protein n=1 Tax=Streptomyces misionensis TaxID=67331 RepID=A0A1H4UQM9_9ACTN|nr:hypothetical protein SAMN04490357_2696 [Streptomyces misionensis]